MNADAHGLADAAKLLEVPVVKAVDCRRGVIKGFQRRIKLLNQLRRNARYFRVELDDRPDAEGICDEDECDPAPESRTEAGFARVVVYVLLVVHVLKVMPLVSGSKRAFELVNTANGRPRMNADAHG